MYRFFEEIVPRFSEEIVPRFSEEIVPRFFEEIVPRFSEEIVGCYDDDACNFNQNTTDVDNGICVFATGCDTCSGETDGSGTVVDNDADF